MDYNSKIIKYNKFFKSFENIANHQNEFKLN